MARKSKVEQLVRTVNTVNQYISSETIKAEIGDSTRNHRSPTVSQFVRYLLTSAASLMLNNARDLAISVDNVHNALLETDAYSRVRRNKNRTDAVDVNEFVKAVNIHANTTARRRELGKLIVNN